MLGGKLNVTSAANALQGVLLFPQLSVITNVIRMDPAMKDYLSTPGLKMTGFTPIDDATKAFLHKIGKYAGVALQDESFMKDVFDYMNVPGRAWTVAELRAAAPITLKTNLDGQGIRVEKDPKAPFGILINDLPIRLPNQATSDRKAVLHVLDGVLIPPSKQPIVDAWVAKAGGGTAAAVDAAAGSNNEKSMIVDAASGKSLRGGPPVEEAAAAVSSARPAVGRSGAGGVVAAAAAALCLAIVL